MDENDKSTLLLEGNGVFLKYENKEDKNGDQCSGDEDNRVTGETLVNGCGKAQY